MNHSFNVEIAAKYGIPCAVILENLAFWIAKNEADGRHFHDGEYWTYSSKKALSKLFPYLTDKQIRSALDKLREEGLIKTGNYNDKPYDRTLWYALTQKGKSICPTGPTLFEEMATPLAPEGQPIPDINPYIDSDIEGVTTRDETEDNSNVIGVSTASCAERCETHPSTPAAKPQPTPSEFNIPLVDGTEYNVPLENIEQYKKLYPGVDVEQALRNMIGWSMTAGPHRKTRRGVKKFITSWLIREQDKSSRKGGGKIGFNRGSAGESPRRLYSGETIV